jgi:hypothetical protein
VTGCIYQATLGGPTTTLYHGFITVAQRQDIAAGVDVWTRTGEREDADRPFFLSVHY